MLAGIPVPAELVRELAERVDEPTAGYLEAALDAGRATFALTLRTASESSSRLRIAPRGSRSCVGCFSASMGGACGKGDAGCDRTRGGNHTRAGGADP
jgi:hypothetical protein